MVQWVKCLLHKKQLSSDSWHPHKKQGTVMLAYDPSTGKAETGGFLWHTDQSGSQSMSSRVRVKVRVSERLCLKKIR